MTELTSRCPDAATAIFNLPDYRVLSTEILGFGQRRILVESTVEPGCPDCGVIGARREFPVTVDVSPIAQTFGKEGCRPGPGA